MTVLLSFDEKTDDARECPQSGPLNIHPPFVVSVAVLIINIHRSRAMK